MSRLPLLVPALFLAAGTAHASTEEAWEAFRADVETACMALVEPPPDTETAIEVNPFGSEHYGAALVSIFWPGEGGTDRMICIYDKQSGAAELTAPFPLDPLTAEDIRPDAP